jgi:sugar phosphate isomerase/epimerase
MMKIGFSVASPEVNTPLLPAQQGELGANLDVLADLGYDGVELSVRLPAELDIPVIEKEFSKRNLEVASIHTAAIGFQDRLWLCHPDEEIRAEAMARLLAAIDVAAHFSVDVLVGSFRGKLGDSEQRKQSGGWMYDAFKKGADHAAGHGNRILFEPQARFSVDFGFTAQDGAAFAEELGSPGFGVMLDTYHMNIEDASFARSIFDAREHLHYLQISDSNRMYPGGGHIDYGEIINALQAIGFDGYLSLQIVREPSYAKAAELGIMHLRSLIGE